MTMVAVSPRRGPRVVAPSRALPKPKAPGARHALVRGALGCPSRDELAHQDICAALLSAPGLDIRNVEVEMTAAGVRLRGTVGHPEDHARALQLARLVAGPRPLRDELTLLAAENTASLSSSA